MTIPVDDRTLKDVYELEGKRGKQWDLSGVLKLLAGVYNASPPTLKDGEAGWVQVDENGRLIIDLELGDAGHGSATSSGKARRWPGWKKAKPH